MSRPVECPFCHNTFDVRTRARIGQGTQRGLSIVKLNKNKVNLLQILRERFPAELHVRQIHAILYDRHIKRWQRGDIDSPTGSWNYHLVQAELSILLGAKMIRMSRSPVESWSEKEQRYVARPLPCYYVQDGGSKT